MKFDEFKELDPHLAQRLVNNAKAIRSISDWQQQLRDRLASALKKRGMPELLPVYQDDIHTDYMSLLEQAELVGDPAMKRIVAHLKDERGTFEKAWGERDEIYHEIADKHGLEVAIVVGGDNDPEGQFEFTAKQ